ncbi:peptidoglycan recognition protein family protein [Brachybacterium massiliense]|uniref:peptidoglycan recognition protein family protein n=1 Tax=Brachybacterium massiliense TaxID=1755098 RepID=UPI001BB03991|nr:N-acetylmuramoyl-L-alanine amidase [Brachybacterium massiliense]
MSIRYDHPRSAWTSKATRSHRFNTRVLGAYLHWPGTPENSLHGESTAQIAARLRGYRDDHVNRRRWKDIAYGAAVDWRGQTWELRGLDHESGANGGPVSNNNGAGILMLLGAREVPTQAMIDGVLRLLAQLKATYPTASWVRGHQQSPEAGGQCPGPAVMGLLKAGRFHYRGPIAVPGGGTSVPAVPSAETAPAFPLPRRKGAMCYYGPPDGPRTSVSGRGLNTLVSGDVQRVGGRWRSHGLARWQQRMRERGYTITVDGRYGDETERIVRYFQQLIGLTVDGKIGPATWAAAWEEPIR